jgi:hypothetical protein
MMLPILISVSLAPESYFFSANEAVVVNESAAVATATATRPLGRLKGIFFFPFRVHSTTTGIIGRCDIEAPGLSKMHRRRNPRNGMVPIP